MKDFFARETHRNITQEYEIEWLLDEMEASGIDCLPMKGWVIRDYYPDPLMRSMTDLDVLVKDMNSRKMQQWMEAHGYHPNHIEQEVHDTYIKPPYMYIELHRRLMGEDWLKRRHTTWREERLASLWQNTYRLEGKSHLYRFSDEDFLVHHLLHFYKHFTGPGVGLRPLADLYLFLQKNKQTLGQEYLKKQLEELHIAAFSEQMERLTSACFEGQVLDERAWLVLDYLARTGDLRKSCHVCSITFTLGAEKECRTKHAAYLLEPMFLAFIYDGAQISAPARCSVAAAGILGISSSENYLSGAL